MKAIHMYAYGGPEVLRYEDAPRPVPSTGQVLVRAAGTSFNPGDAFVRSGGMRHRHEFAMPQILGMDLSGTVVELGPGVNAPTVGDQVISFLPWPANGGYGEYVAVPVEALAPAPVSIPLADAAALPVAGLTAWQAIHEQLRLAPGQRILVNGAGGGVGRLAVQFAKVAGATVVAVAGPRSVATAHAAGADEVHDYSRPWHTEPVDAVLQAAGGGSDRLVALIKPGGSIVSITAPVPVNGRDVTSSTFELRSDIGQLTEIARWVDTGAVTTGITERLPLSELPAVHRRHATGDLHGKVVLMP
ncbi:hypothetical protein BWI15_32105 [Kribbella sp. ALI-6-A]|uniref:NADP-dependent oxidoreductase n=1 Tax=Kribbella sp. ALI-6-A TaxID=1933817 RepID=UPI00097C2990|nr:NADP-dependent oxidoreductase [Kribbella sp. ALI-6-A]ONI67737.1 hypothetical protein BWI15_32105 [Kribbella sp. ALI-6-A]